MIQVGLNPSTINFSKPTFSLKNVNNLEKGNSDNKQEIHKNPAVNFDTFRANRIPSFGANPTALHFQNEYKKLCISPEKFINLGVTKGKYLGEGNFGKAYDIPVEKFKNYVIKIEHVANPKNISSFKPVKDILPGINVGQPVGNLGENFLVLKKVPGQIGVCFHPNENATAKELQAHYLNKLDLAASVGQEGFDNFAKLAVYLNSKGHAIDKTYGNLYIERNKSFNPLDIFYNTDEKTNVFDILFSLLGYSPTFTDVLTKEMVNKQKTIIYRALKACNKANIPMPPKHPINEANINSLLSSAEINTNSAELRSKLLEAKEKNNPDLFEKFLDSVFGKQVEVN